MGFATEWKNILTQRYAELRRTENRIKDAMYPRPLQESRTSLHGKKMVFLCGPRPCARGRRR
jgi:hypothetical protein